MTLVPGNFWTRGLKALIIPKIPQIMKRIAGGLINNRIFGNEAGILRRATRITSAKPDCMILLPLLSMLFSHTFFMVLIDASNTWLRRCSHEAHCAPWKCAGRNSYTCSSDGPIRTGFAATMQSESMRLCTGT